MSYDGTEWRPNLPPDHKYYKTTFDLARERVAAQRKSQAEWDAGPKPYVTPLRTDRPSRPVMKPPGSQAPKAPTPALQAPKAPAPSSQAPAAPPVTRSRPNPGARRLAQMSEGNDVPKSQAPRHSYRGPQSERDFDSFMRSDKPLHLDPNPPKKSITSGVLNEVTSGVLGGEKATPAAQAPFKRMSGAKGVLIGAGAAAAGSAAYAHHRRRSRVRKAADMILVDPFSGGLLEVSKAAYPVALPVPSSRRVKPRTPSGPHVSHVNDYEHFHHNTPNPRDSRVQQFHSGTMTEKELKGGGRSFGSRARRVKKSFDGHSPIVGGGAEVGRRGTPLADLGRHNRRGMRISA